MKLKFIQHNMFSVRLKIPEEQVIRHFGKSISLHSFFEEIYPYDAGSFTVESIVYKNFKTDELMIKGKALTKKRSPMKGSLTLIICVPNKKEIAMKWFVPMSGKGQSLHIASGVDFEILQEVMIHLASKFLDYRGHRSECVIETLNSKFEFEGASEIKLGPLALMLEAVGQNVQYNPAKNPPKVSLFILEPKFTAIIFRTSIINFMGLRIASNTNILIEVQRAAEALAAVLIRISSLPRLRI